jgi:hypothetical protein
MPSEEVLRKEAEMADRFAAEDAAHGRLGFSLQRGKGKKSGARQRAEARMQQRTVDSYAAKPERRPSRKAGKPTVVRPARTFSAVPPRKANPFGKGMPKAGE